MDNLRVHHANKVSEWVEKRKDRIELFYFPPYAPEYNPDELLNSDVKRNARAKTSPRSQKVFPYNFRHLFAVSFYWVEKDIAKLADLLDHASINTTRIYIMESGAEHERQLERLGLVA